MSKENKDKKANPTPQQPPPAVAATPPESVHHGDGFDGYKSSALGSASRRVIQGTLLSFNNDATWTDGDDAPFPPNRELVAVDFGRVVQKWIDQLPVEKETRWLAPEEEAPDIEAMNNECPRSEWGEVNGQPRGPYQLQHIVYLLDLNTMEKFTFPTGTVGGRIAVDELAEAVQWMRRLRPGVYATVTLSDKFMRTRWGGRQRPWLKIKGWVSLGGSEAVPAPNTPLLPKSSASTSGAQSVEQPSLKEELNDDIAF
jgi:hypothetical protein